MRYLLTRVGTGSSLNLGSVVRILIDSLVVGGTLATLALAREWLAWTIEEPTLAKPIAGTMSPGSLVAGVFILVSISINVFFLMGIYDLNRWRDSSNKIRTIIEAVAVSHILFGFILLMVRDFIDFSRGVLLVNFLATTLILVVIRIHAVHNPFVQNVLEGVDRLGKSEEPIKRVLVVGGAGYIGSALLRRLLDSGYEVRLLDILLFGAEPIEDLLDHPNLELQVDDCRQVDAVVRAVAGMDAVVHLAAIVGDPACEIDHDLTVDTNFLATRMLAEVAQAAGVRRFIFASTCSVYGASDEVLDEHSDLQPVSLYAKSKIACEEILTNIKSDTFAPTILRFGTIYGLSGRTRFDLVVNLLTAKAVTDGRITIHGGDQWRPFLHVDDAAAAIFAALEAPRHQVHGKTFNVGSDEQNHTIDQVANLIQSFVPSAEILQMGSDGDRRDYRVDFSRIREDLGFTPAWTIEMGINQVIEAIRSGHVTDHLDPRYSNVKALVLRGRVDHVNIDLTRLGPKTTMIYGMSFDRMTGSWTRSLLTMLAEERMSEIDLTDSGYYDQIG